MSLARGGRRSPGGSRGTAFLVLFCLALVTSGAVASASTPGSTIWTKRYNGPAGGFDAASSVAVSPDGSRVFVTGLSESSTSDHYATLAYDASSGALIWVRRYAAGGSTPPSLAVSPDSTTVFVTGSTALDDYATEAFDASTGATIWARRYNGPGQGVDQASSVAVDPHGTTVFVTGTSDGSDGLSDYATLAYDAGTGTTMWTQRYDGPAADSEGGAETVAASPDGTKVFVTGTSSGSNGRGDYATLAYDAATGARIWTKRYDGPSHGTDFTTGLAVSPDGNTVFVTGGSFRRGTRRDYLTLAYDAATGSRIWTRRYDGPQSAADTATSIAVSPDSRMTFVTGYSVGSGTADDYATLAYDASTGATRWVKRYNDSFNVNDRAFAIAASLDGRRVFVTGASPGAGSKSDYKTLAYDASSGATVWGRRYDGPINLADTATSLAINTSSTTVFVTGESVGLTGNFDYATVAYGA